MLPEPILERKKTLEKVRIVKSPIRRSFNPNTSKYNENAEDKQTNDQTELQQAEAKLKMASIPSHKVRARRNEFRKTQGSFYETKGSLNYQIQQKECNRINKDNQILALNLINLKPTINFKKI